MITRGIYGLVKLTGLIRQLQKFKNFFIRIWRILNTAIDIVRQNGPLLVFSKGCRLLSREGLPGLIQVLDENWYYKLWIKKNKLTEEKIAAIKQDLKSFAYKPLISVILPVYNIEESYLRECITSVQDQYYPNWELCIADDASPGKHVRRVLEEKASEDNRIKVIYRPENGHISAASNSALALAEGEFVALLDHDDRLAPEALYENVKLLNREPEADMIYSDEDKINEAGKRQLPFFKPDWSPDTFLSQMYTCHLGVYRTNLVREIGGFREGFEGSQDYDLVLRLTEKTDRIYHIPKVLYHWRAAQTSSAMNSGAKIYAYEAGQRVLQETTQRRGEPALVERIIDRPGNYRVSYLLKEKPKIAIIIIAGNDHAVLEKCLLSIWEKSDYPNYEVIIIKSGASGNQANENFLTEALEMKEVITVLQADDTQSYARMYNQAAAATTSKLLLFLSNRIDLITPNWLTEMSAQAIRPSIGAVGAKLFYPDRSIEHAGVTIGLDGTAGHGHRYFKGDSSGYHNRLKINANYAAVSGACLMVENELFSLADGFDEQMGNDFFDVDFCLRLYEKGYYNMVLADVQLYHDIEKGGKRIGQGSSIFCERWANYLKRDPFYNPNLTLKHYNYSIRLE